VNNFEQPRVQPTSFKLDSRELFIAEMLGSIETQVQNERTNSSNKKLGRKGGRPPALNDEKLADMKSMFQSGKTQLEIGQKFNISQASISRYYNEIILGNGRAPRLHIGRIPASSVRSVVSMKKTWSETQGTEAGNR